MCKLSATVRYSYYRTRVVVNLIDVTLACEDDNSKLVEVVTVAHVDNEKHVDNSLVQIWKIDFGHKVKFSRFQGLFKILKLYRVGEQ